MKDVPFLLVAKDVKTYYAISMLGKLTRSVLSVG
jgi:hypothetical protein